MLLIFLKKILKINSGTDEDKYLVDVYRSDEDRQSFTRPNQLFAIGLPYICISKEKADQILKTVKQHLPTPYGLRTLSPRNPFYNSEFNGGQTKRDMTYHMGMIWPWLIGIYSDAFLNINLQKRK